MPKFIHGHDGSLPLMRVGAQNLVEETTTAECVILNWLAPLRKVYNPIRISKQSEGYGGEGETARLPVTYSKLVQPEQSEPFHVPPEEMRKLQGPEPIKTGGAIFNSTRQYPHTHIGTPPLAQPKTGEKGDEVITQWITAVIKPDFLTGRERYHKLGRAQVRLAQLRWSMSPALQNISVSATDSRPAG